MPFTSETAKRYRGPGHRPRRRDVEEKKTAAEVVRAIIEGNAEVIAKHFVRRSKKSDRVLCHAIDKLIPDLDGKTAQQSGDTYIQFNFGSESGERDVTPRLPQAGERGHLNGRAICFVGDESGG